METTEFDALKQRRKARKKGRQAGAATEGKVQSGAPDPRRKSKVREWIDALAFALVAAVLIRALFLEPFRIPTPSMEKNLMVGDWLLVSKLHYGPRTPVTLGIPFTDIYLTSLELPTFRLPGFSQVRRGDALVFNYPVESKPIDRKMHYIKRVVGMPGDTLRISNKIVSINGEMMPLDAGMQQEWIVHKQDRVVLPVARLKALGVSELSQLRDPNQIIIQATPEAVAEIASWPYIEQVEPFVLPSDARFSAQVFPPESGYTRDNYGPLLVPERGQTVTVTADNWPALRDVIIKYEGQDADFRSDGTFMVNGRLTEQYTFQQDYYFMMGDNRDNSEDSRFWGFVPQDHVVGKALLVYFSWDNEAGLPRFSRLFHMIR